MSEEFQPIGYWLKHLDEMLTRRSDQALQESGFTRSHWQVINTIYETNTTTREDVLAALKMFMNSNRLDEILGEFAREGWLVVQGSGEASQLSLTEAGREKREAVFKLQSEVRRRLMQGITHEEYATVVDVLQRMATNLE